MLRLSLDVLTVKTHIQARQSAKTDRSIIEPNSPAHGSEPQTGCVCAVMLLASRVGTVQDGSGHVAWSILVGPPVSLDIQKKPSC